MESIINADTASTNDTNHAEKNPPLYSTYSNTAHTAKMVSVRAVSVMVRRSKWYLKLRFTLGCNYRLGKNHIRRRCYLEILSLSLH